MAIRALIAFLVFFGVARAEVPYQAAPRTDENSRLAHQQLLEKIWADALKPIFTELLGPPAAVDRAPPPTGDPSATSASGGASTT